MALEIRPGPVEQYQHVCPLPWPVDPEVPEGHVCECGRRWVYQPAHWDPLLTLDQLRMRQEAGAFLRGIIPTFHHADELPGEAAGSLDMSPDEEEKREPAVIVDMRETAVIVPIPTPRK